MPDKYEHPGYEESWMLVKKTMDWSAGRNTADGVEELKNVFEANKQRIRALFPADGRLELQMEGLPFNMDWEQVIDKIRAPIYTFAEKQAGKDKFADVSQHGFRFAVDWLINIIQNYGIVDVAKNRTQDGKGPAITTVIGDSFNNAGTAWNDGIMVVGDYNHYLRRYPAKTKPQVLEYVQLVMSEVIAKLKPLVDQKLTVGLSINPFDLLITSMHTTGWNSCHNIQQGAHRAGNIGYMCDPVTAVVYAYQQTAPLQFWHRRGDQPTPYPKKMWRAVTFLDIDNLQAIISRQYPGPQPEMSRMARRMIAQILRESTGNTIPYEWIVRKSDRSVGKSAEEAEEITAIDFPVKGQGWLYVDQPTEHIRMKQGGKRVPIIVGIKEIPCMDCGDPRFDGNSREIICPDCGGENGHDDDGDDDDDGFYCHHCDTWTHQEQIQFHEGQPHCLHCLHEHHPELEEAV